MASGDNAGRLGPLCLREPQNHQAVSADSGTGTGSGFQHLWPGPKQSPKTLEVEQQSALYMDTRGHP